MKLAQLGLKERDSALVVSQKQFLIYQGSAMSMGGLVWGTLLLIFDIREPAIIPFSYVIINMSGK